MKKNNRVFLENIQYADDLKLYDSNYYVAGFTFAVENSDGFAHLALLKKYDRDLNLQWCLEIQGESRESRLTSILFANNRIYALAKQCTSTAQSFDDSLSLYIISLDGEILDKIFVAKNCFGIPDTLAFEKDKIYFAFAQSEGNYYNAIKSVVSILVEVDLATNACHFFEGKMSMCIPHTCLRANETSYVVSSYERDYSENIIQQYLMIKNEHQASEIILPTDQYEWVLGVLQTETHLVIATTYNREEDENSYIKTT